MEIKGEINTNKIFSESLNPDNLIVEDGEGPSTDPSVIQITQNKMDSLKIFKSETVLLKGQKGKETICICLPDFNGKLSDNQIRMGKCVRNNLDVAIGDIISIEKYHIIPLGNRVHILPFKDTIQGISGNLTKKFLIPFFKDAYRPVHKGDTFICSDNFREVEFKVVDTDPEKYCIVGPNTVIFDEGEPIKRYEENNNFIVEEGEGPSTDPSIIQITQNKMDNLKIFKSETVLLKGKKGKETICICLPDYNSKLSDNKIRMGKCVRNNLKVKLGDIISIEKYPLIPLGNKVHILPFEDTIQGISGNLTKKYLIPFFKDAYRPVYKGDTFICKGENGFKEVEFKVIDTDPEKCCIVGPHTVILDEGEPLKRDKETEEEIEYDDINKKGDNKENSIAIIFRSIDQNITYAAVCKESDNFAKVGQEVLKEYPQLKDKNIFYIHEGSIIDRNKTLKENKVKHNSNILINIQ